jgi:hypothetical protein
MGKKEETFNNLAERFQWHGGIDPDHIFDEEKEMIKELREQVPELEKETDKFVAVFLFSRRHGKPHMFCPSTLLHLYRYQGSERAPAILL